MTIYDAAMAGLIIGGMIWGAWRGITWQIASIASLVLGYTVSRTMSAELASKFSGDPLLTRGLAMFILYVATSGGVFFVAWVIRSTLRKLKFEAYDRHLGMVLGGFECALIGMVATLFVVSLAPQSREPIFSSTTGRVVGKVMNVLGPALPAEAREKLAPFWSGDSAPSPVEQVARDRDTSPASRPTSAIETATLPVSDADADATEPKLPPIRFSVGGKDVNLKLDGKGGARLGTKDGYEISGGKDGIKIGGKDGVRIPLNLDRDVFRTSDAHDRTRAAERR